MDEKIKCKLDRVGSEISNIFKENEYILIVRDVPPGMHIHYKAATCSNNENLIDSLETVLETIKNEG